MTFGTQSSQAISLNGSCRSSSRLRPESFADHYSQARQFYISQTGAEQRHIASALTFELSKVETLVIRERMVSHLMNIDETLATTVAQKLGFKSMPKAADAAMPTRQDLEPSPALSIVERGPKRFEGRKLGILITDGVDAKLLKGLTDAIVKEKAVLELIAPKVGGVTASDGTLIAAHHMIDGGPSVLFDAVAILTSAFGIEDLVNEAAARDFVADAFQHCKFIGYDHSAVPLLEKAGIADSLDEGVRSCRGKKDFPPSLPNLANCVSGAGSRRSSSARHRPRSNNIETVRGSNFHALSPLRSPF